MSTININWLLATNIFSMLSLSFFALLLDEQTTVN